MVQLDIPWIAWSREMVVSLFSKGFEKNSFIISQSRYPFWKMTMEFAMTE